MLQAEQVELDRQELLDILAEQVVLELVVQVVSEHKVALAVLVVMVHKVVQVELVA